MMRGSTLYATSRCEEEGYYLLAVAIVRRTLMDAAIDPARCKKLRGRREAERHKQDAEFWLEQVNLAQGNSS
jgi:hypothetical protein